MLSEFKITLKCEGERPNYNIGSLLHGALMESLPDEYAGRLHENGLKPFSMSVAECKGNAEWRICCLNRECSHYFAEALMDDSNSIYLKKKNYVFNVLSKSVNTMSYDALINSAYSSKHFPLVRVKFLSPTSFKSAGRYVIIPNMNMIFGSIIKKFDTFSEKYKVYDEDAFDYMINNIAVVSYNMRSTVFHVESVRIPSFIGQFTLKNGGTKQMWGLLNLLLSFGEYSGVGVKTSLGMGAMKREDVNNNATK